MYKNYIFLVLLFAGLRLSAQDSLQVIADSIPESPSKYNAALNYISLGGGMSTSAFTPFWIQSNRYGVIPNAGSFVSGSAGIEHRTSILSKKDTTYKWSFGYGFEAAVNYFDSEVEMVIPQTYGTIAFHNWELMVGRKKMHVGLADSTLGSGSYAWSGNAHPITRIKFGLRDFTPVPFTKEIFWIMGFYSDGRFQNDRPRTSELRLHQKALYGQLRLWKDHFRICAGFNHQVQWGGLSPDQTINDTMPRGFKNYKRVVLGKSVAGTNEDLPDIDAGNRLGNHLGTIDIGFEIHTKKALFFAYRQSIFEDGSLYYLTNVQDGLHGIKYKSLQPSRSGFNIHEVVLEYLYTKSQGGPEFVPVENKRRGKDNYFNNSQVADGWSESGRTIGTPFITPTSQTEWAWPTYHIFFTSNNRVEAFYLGLRGGVGSLVDWTLKGSYSKNAGTYDRPFPGEPKQISALVALTFNTELIGPGTLISISGAVDQGDLFPDTFGLEFSLKKQGLWQ